MLNKMLMINKSSGRSISRLFVEKYFLPLFFIAMIIAIISSGCNKDFIERIEEVLPPCDTCGTAPCNPDTIVACGNSGPTVFFATDIAPIFTTTSSPNCTACHPGTNALDLTAANAYDQLWTSGPNAPYIDTTNAEASILYQKINTGGTMEQYITTLDRTLILTWIQEGALNN